MTKYLLLSFILLLPVLAVSQRIYDPTPSLEMAARKAPVTHAKAVIDTLFPAALDSVCADTARIFGLAGGNGFVGGTNSLFDLAKGMRFVNAGADAFAVTKVGVAFAVTDSASQDSYISVDIYTDPAAGPVSLLGSSDSVQLSTVQVATSELVYTEFTFPEPVNVTTDSFLVLVDLSRTYRPNSTYTSLYQTDAGCGNGSNAFEIYLENNQVGLGTIRAGWGTPGGGRLESEFYMYVVYDDAVVSTRRPSIADYSVRISPNPTNGRLNVAFEADQSGDYSLLVTDINGRVVRSRRSRHAAGPAAVDVDVSTLSGGVYLYHLAGPQGKQSGRFVKH